MLAADVALRLFAPLSELRIGVLTALIGAPFFVWLVLKTRAGAGAMTATLPDMLSARGVGVRLAGRCVLDAVDLSVEPGEIDGRHRRQRGRQDHAAAGARRSHCAARRAP